MALPESFHTPERIIRQAMRDAGRLQFGADPTPEQWQDAMDRLADLIIGFQVTGLKLWLVTQRTVTLVASQRTYDIDTPRELRVLEAWYVRTDGHRQPVNIETRNTYYNLGTLINTGTPVALLADKQQSKIVVSLWPTPDASAVANGSLELTVQGEATAPTTLDEAIAFPPEWYMALRWGLADELASGQPIQIMERCEKKAMLYKELLEEWDVEEGPIAFSPALRQHTPSRFSR